MKIMQKIRQILSLLLACALLFSCTSLAEGFEPILAVGGSFAYLRDTEGTLWVFGDNQFGQLGKGNAKQSKKPALFSSKNEEIDVLSIAGIYTGCDYSYFLMKDGSIWGCGNNTNGALCTKYRASTHIRIPLEDDTIQTMACGFGHTLALNAAGEVYAWGRGSSGQIGNGKNIAVMTPTKLDLQNIVAIAAGGKFSIALDADGVLWGWGDNTNHQLSPDKTKLYKSPIRIDTGDLNIVMIDAGGSYISIVDDQGDLYMWGINDHMQLGFDNKKKDVTTPTKVDLPLPVTYLASYSSQTYVILSDGSLWGWGNNSYGQLGIGSEYRTASSTGLGVQKIFYDENRPVVAVQGGSLFMLAMLEDGTILACGINKFGQLGIESKEYEICTIFENGFDLIAD